MELKKITIFIDLLFCCVILPVIIMLVPVDRWIVKYPVFANLLVVYLYVLYLSIRKLELSRLVMERKYVKILIIITVFFVSAYVLSHFPFPHSYTSSFPPVIVRHLRIQTVWLLVLVVVGFGMSVELRLELYKHSLRYKDIEAAKNRAELALYKAQIDPHFMFNTLNSLYGLVISKSDKAEEAFIKFTDILQYMYSNAQSETIEIHKEIEYIQAYIDLQSLRLNSHTHVICECDTDDAHIRIAPMILITFVENAFKYGSSSSRDSTIRLRVRVERGELQFESENTVIRGTESRGTYIGIENCRSRLELLYGGRYDLDVNDDGEKYVVRLKIRLR